MYKRLGTVGVVALLALSASALPAWAQEAGYSVSDRSNLYVRPPSTAEVIDLGVADDDAVARDLPFTFRYFGRAYDEIGITRAGYCQIGDIQYLSQPANDPFPIVQEVGIPDGVLAPLWDDHRLEDDGEVLVWTQGSAPNRKFFVTWRHMHKSGEAASDYTFQLQLFETTGLIAFAYEDDSAMSTWLGLDYSSGIKAPEPDPRWLVPVNTNDDNAGHPGSDYLFTPNSVRFTGSVLYERPAADATGLGNTTLTDLVPEGLRVELRDNGEVAGSTTIQADGSFSLIAFEGLPDSGPSLELIAQTEAGSVHPDAAAEPYRYVLAAGLNYDTDQDFDETILADESDLAEGFRRPMSIALAAGRALAWADPLSAAQIEPLTMVYDDASADVTGYTPAVDPDPPVLRIGGSASGDLDAWDDDVVIKTYARHLLASIAVPTTEGADPRFDVATTPENAFAEGFGYYVAAAVAFTDQFVNTTSDSTAVVHDLETPGVSTRPGPDVAGRVAGALYDYLDGANEARDRINGGGGPGGFGGPTGEHPYRVAARLTVVPTVDAFYDAWTADPVDSLGLSRIFIAHGIVTDDAHEANDDDGEPADAGSAGVRLDDLVLSKFQEDWFEVEAAGTLVVEVAFNRVTFDTTIEVELRRQDGTVLAVGTTTDRFSRFQATASGLPQDAYLVRVRHLAGDGIGSYTMQAFAPLAVNPDALRDWTVGRPYEVDVESSGGVGARTLSANPLGSQPPGFAFPPGGRRVSGTPQQVGTFDFAIAVTDSGNPSHVATASKTIVVNPRFALITPAYVGLPLDVPYTTPPLSVGGTPPMAYEIAAGNLPGGVAVAGDDLTLTGTATTAASTPFEVRGTDAAGSASIARTNAVVCVPIPSRRTPLSLPGGATERGYYFDAVSGSKATITLGTARRAPRRPLQIVVLGPDGQVVDEGRFRAGRGGASARRVPCDLTGRYFVIVIGGDGGSTQLFGTPRIALQRRGRGAVVEFRQPDVETVRLGALEGAKLIFRSGAPRRSGLVPEALELIDPDGVSVSLDGQVTVTRTGFVLRTELGKSGTWTVRVGANADAVGKLRYSFVLRQPRGVTFSAD